MEPSDLDKSIITTALAIAVLSVEHPIDRDNADVHAFPDTVAALSSSRTMCTKNMFNAFDGRARMRFLVDIVLSVNSVPECLAELATILQGSEQSAREICGYISERIADYPGVAGSNMGAAQLLGLRRLYYCLLTGSAAHATFSLIEATLRAMGCLCLSLPPSGCILDYYGMYEHLGALGQMAFDAVVALRSERGTTSDIARHRERIARALVDTVSQAERLPLVVAVLHSILRVLCDGNEH